MRKIYTIIVLSLLIFEANAQTISGTIKDVNTNESLIGVNIILNNGNGTATDFDGNYQISGKEGEQQITFKYIGYEEVLKTISLNKNEVKNLDVVLVPSSEQLSTVVVSAGRFEQKIEEITVSMEVIKPSLIENKNTTDIQTAMDQIPGVNITDGQANIRGGSGWSFGAGTRVLVMVDDMPLISGDAGQVQWKLIATENINQVEVIKGASSALYGSSALNGVINIRTAFPSQKDIDKNKSPGYTKVNMHFGLIDFAKRRSLNWNGMEKGELSRRSFKGIEFLQSMKLDNLDLSLGGNIFKDDGYRYGEITDRKRFNLNSTYKSKKIEGLSYGLNANFLFQSTGSAIIWNGYDQAYIPLDSSVTTTSGDTYNIDPSITYLSGNNRHSLKTRYLKVINDNSADGEDAGQDNESETYYADYQWQKNLEDIKLRITTGVTNEIVFARSDLFSGN
ncbi:MAG: TonB-dependent receptor plug domain-containing protein, partial [Flavobacteriales bacterium]|nr:TonB-dependent receptor plug domain-containing protein [Flavobacteriales bacterium]